MKYRLFNNLQARVVDFWRNLPSGAKVKFTTPSAIEWPEWVWSAFRKDGFYLDFGAGYGRVTKELVLMGFQNVTLIDVSRELIASAQQNLKGLNESVKLNFIVGGVDALPSNILFDGVFVCGVIEYFLTESSRKDFVRKIADNIVNEGYLYLETFTIDTLRSKELYEKAVGVGLPYGSVVVNDDLVVFHDSIDGIKRLFGDVFEVVNERQVDFKTWKGRSVNGYQVLFRKIVR